VWNLGLGTQCTRRNRRGAYCWQHKRELQLTSQLKHDLVFKVGTMQLLVGW
jgi:hypothetical protein